jgi:hypothetical protein
MRFSLPGNHWIIMLILTTVLHINLLLPNNANENKLNAFQNLMLKKNDSMGLRFIMCRYYLLPMKSIRLDNNCLCS